MSLRSLLFSFCLIPVLGFSASAPSAGNEWLEFAGKKGPGHGLHVVLVSGDEEYRSEETMPMLAKILSQRHGFDCTVLFAIDPATGVINPNLQTNIPGLKALERADLVILNTRFRQLPPEQLEFFAKYVKAGKPIIGLRTATHAFTGEAVSDGIVWKDFGLNVLGEKWVAHHGDHKVQGTRAAIEPAQAQHPILQGVRDIFGPTDVYTVKNLTPDATILLRGLVTATLAPDSKAVEDAKNNPPMPLAWLRDYHVAEGKTGKAFCTTMGASVDFLSADLRRLVVNAVFSLTKLPVPAAADVAFADPFQPTFYGSLKGLTGWANRGLKPADFALGKATVPFAEIVAPKDWSAATEAKH